MRVSRPPASLDRSAAGLIRSAVPHREPAPPQPSIAGTQPNPARSHVGGGMLPAPANTVALSDGTRISFRAVEELPELVD